MSHHVRLTINPDEIIEVSDVEFENLEFQGFIHSQPREATVRKAAEKAEDAKN